MVRISEGFGSSSGALVVAGCSVAKSVQKRSSQGFGDGIKSNIAGPELSQYGYWRNKMRKIDIFGSVFGEELWETYL